MTTTTPVRAWHGSQELKDRTIARMRAHAATDRLIRGSYIDLLGGDWKGCFHGCLVVEDLAAEQDATPMEARPECDSPMLEQDAWWETTERLYGIHDVAGAALDGVYEQLDMPAGDVAVRLLEAIPVGAYLKGLDREIAEAVEELGDDDVSDEDVLDRVCAILAAAPIVEVTP